MLRCMSLMRHIRKDIFQLTQTEFGAICGVTQATISRWEDGLLAPDLKELERIRSEAIRRGIDWEDSIFFDFAPPEGQAA